MEDQMEQIMIDVQNVSVRFNLMKERTSTLKEYAIRLLRRQLLFEELWALKGVSFSLAKGDSMALIGRNGSGKSTMLKAICGVITPSTGSVEVHGSIAPLIELGVGFDVELTARENIYLNGALMGNDRKFMNAHFDEIVEFSELQDFLDVPIKNFSSGMFSRLGFSIATIVKTDILLIDEILAVGDSAFQIKCEEKINQLLSGGTTLVFVSHDANQVKRLCKKAIWLDHGIVKMQGDVNTVCDEYSRAFQKPENA